MPMTPSGCQKPCFFIARTACSMVARVAAEKDRLEIGDGAGDGPRLPFERRFAPTNESVLVGEDADEDPVAQRGIDDMRLDRGDLHAGGLVAPEEVLRLRIDPACVRPAGGAPCGSGQGRGWMVIGFGMRSSLIP